MVNLTEKEQMLIARAVEMLRPLGMELANTGWHPEIIVFGPYEVERIPGYKVALLIPIDSVTQ